MDRKTGIFKKIPIVLIITDSMSIGGKERQIIELMRGLRKNGKFRLALSALVQGGELIPEAMKLASIVLPVQKKCCFDITVALLLLMQCKKQKIDLIHTFGWTPSILGLFVAKFLGIPIINGYIRHAPPTLSIRQRISKRFLRHSDFIVANSVAGLKAYGIIDNKRSVVIYNGVDFERFRNISPQRFGTPSICMVGNFSINKDQSSLIKALPECLRAFPNTKLVLVGRDMGTLHTNRSIVNRMGLKDCVVFFTNTSHPEPFIAGSDVCFLGTNIKVHGEGISNAIMEYMALGKPVIATDCGGTQEIIKDRVNGYLVTSNKATEIAEKIITLFKNLEKAKDMGGKGNDLVREKFTLKRMVSEYEALYSKILQAHDRKKS